MQRAHAMSSVLNSEIWEKQMMFGSSEQKKEGNQDKLPSVEQLKGEESCQFFFYFVLLFQLVL